jgi:flagellin-like protein
MKSITPVISVILMVLITIVASVSAFFFINSNVSDLQSQGNLDTNPVMDNSRLNLVSITGSKAIVRNDGTSPVTEVVMFVNGELLNYTLDTPILPGQLKEIDYTAQIAGEDLEIKIIYNAGKTTTLVSSANKNIESSGFVESTEPDYSLNNCLNNDSNNVWFNNVLIGNNSACCGDDGTLDDFYNSTNYCCDGVLDTGTCHCGNNICQSWENISNCLTDCVGTCNEIQGSCNQVYFSGVIISNDYDYCSCCGDDGINDTFYNSTLMCGSGGVIFNQDSLYVEDWFGDNYNHTSGKDICELQGNDWLSSVINYNKTDIGTTTGHVRALDIGDIDGDTDLDLISASEETSEIFKWVNDGLGNLTKISLGTASYYPTDLAFGDIDGDTDLDFISVDYNLNVNKWVNDGTGSFTKIGLGTLGDNVLSVALGDIDGDTDLDLIVGDETNLSKWVNNGTGSFTKTLIEVNFSRSDARDIALGDIDDDNDLDIISIAHDIITKWVNDGLGNFVNTTLGRPIPGDYSFAIALGDIDGDGDIDFLNSLGGRLYKWVNDGTGSFIETLIDSTGSNIYALEFGDIDGDGDLDAIGGQANNQVNMWINDGFGTFTRTYINSAGAAIKSVSIGDIDGDGDLDFFTGDYLNKVLRFINYGINGTLGPCCGDDGIYDNFSNSTHQCISGVFSSI